MIDPGNSQEKKEIDEVVVPEQQKLSQVQQDQQESQMQEADSATEQVATEENKNAADETTVEDSSSRGKKRIKKVRQPTEAELMPRPSIWPLLLAFSIAVMLGGFAFNLIILGVGVIMVIASVIGWNLERR